jgi:hypothetical protein
MGNWRCQFHGSYGFQIKSMRLVYCQILKSRAEVLQRLVAMESLAASVKVTLLQATLDSLQERITFYDAYLPVGFLASVHRGYG